MTCLLFAIEYPDGEAPREQFQTISSFDARITALLRLASLRFIISDHMISEDEPLRFLFDPNGGSWKFSVIKEKEE